MSGWRVVARSIHRSELQVRTVSKLETFIKSLQEPK